jgi:tetratricopeptide (TPR) repeat protein
MSKALELEPSSLFFNLMMGNMYFFARRYDEAILQYKKAIELYPDNLSLYRYLEGCYEAKEMYSEAFDYYLLANKQNKKNPEEFQELKNAYEKGGWEGFQRASIENNFKERKTRLEKDPTAYIRSRDIAFDYANLRDRKKTLKYLNKAFEERDYWLIFLKVEYKFDFVRDDPQFKELIKKVGIPE